MTASSKHTHFAASQVRHGAVKAAAATKTVSRRVVQKAAAKPTGRPRGLPEITGGLRGDADLSVRAKDIVRGD